MPLNLRNFPTTSHPVNMIDQSKARRLTLEQQFDWGKEKLPLEKCLGRALREDIMADRPQPPFNRVTMDGIAIDYSRYAQGQRFFSISGLHAAGDAPKALKDSAKCLEIMTGAALPNGYTTVIRYEDLTAREGGFQLPEDVKDNKNIHVAGSDLPMSEQPVIRSGTKITPGAIGALATFGYDRLKVSKLPRVAVVSTGNELVAVSKKNPAEHQIRRSNIYQLATLLAKEKIEVSLHHFEDDQKTLERGIQELIRQHHIVIFSGGVSKGKLDFLPEVFEKLGIRKLFHGVAQRPGKPLWVGRTDGCMVFGLPGNPISSLACLLLYVGPFIRKNLGLQSPETRKISLGKSHRFVPDLDLALAVSLEVDGFGSDDAAMPVESQGSGDALSLLRTDGFLLLPRGKKRYEAGRRYEYLPIDRLF
ncbi:molybdopterin molybdenumtransferase MoeA [Lewinellaceae bacterium SD302]|nr:molybdopterin molybdenumtransferase MoeA [Lewinellaceae bacterium SD302]